MIIIGDLGMGSSNLALGAYNLYDGLGQGQEGHEKNNSNTITKKY